MMDYSDVNRKHYRIVKCVAVDKNGKARFVLANGKLVTADTPEEAEKKLAKAEKGEL